MGEDGPCQGNSGDGRSFHLHGEQSSSLSTGSQAGSCRPVPRGLRKRRVSRDVFIVSGRDFCPLTWAVWGSGCRVCRNLFWHSHRSHYSVDFAGLVAWLGRCLGMDR